VLSGRFSLGKTEENVERKLYRIERSVEKEEK